jgi:TRAP transporter TAXI family solute receptor
MGQAIASVVNAHYDGVVLNAEVTNGALENNRLVNDGEAALGITNADLAYYAYNGQKPYDAKQDIVALGNLHPSVFHIITLADSPINSIEDLKGKRVACGPAGGASIGIMENILAEYGMSFDDIIPSYLPYSDGYTQMADGNVDVALATSGYPAAAVMEVTATKKIKFLEVEPDVLKRMLDKYPYYTDAIVPKDVYKLDSDVTVIGISNVLVCRSDMDEDLAYNIAKALYDNVAELKEINKTAEQIDETKLSETSIPLHPGAQKYFDER